MTDEERADAELEMAEYRAERARERARRIAESTVGECAPPEVCNRKAFAGFAIGGRCICLVCSEKKQND